MSQHYAVVAFEQLIGVETEIRDAVARLHALFQKRACQSFAALAKFAISELARARDDPDFVGKKIDGSVQTPHGCQRDEHWSIVLLERCASLITSKFLASRASHFHIQIA